MDKTVRKLNYKHTESPGGYILKTTRAYIDIAAYELD